MDTEQEKLIVESIRDIAFRLGKISDSLETAVSRLRGIEDSLDAMRER